MEIKRKEKEALLARLGARVRALRLEADLTVSAFAKRASLSPRFINKLEAGTGNISVARLAQVAAALGRALPELLPPPEADHSLRAEVWRSLADCGDGDLHELRQWLAVRNGHGATPRYIALIGILNAGKSTIGPLLSRQLKTDFVELDHEIEEAAGMPLADLFATHGEDITAPSNTKRWPDSSPLRAAACSRRAARSSRTLKAGTWSNSGASPSGYTRPPKS